MSLYCSRNSIRPAAKAERILVVCVTAEQVAEKIKMPSFRGTLRAEESLFS